jgi:hypothetical protein
MVRVYTPVSHQSGISVVRRSPLIKSTLLPAKEDVRDPREITDL